MFIAQVRKIINRIVEINVVVVKAVQVRTDVVSAAHRNHAAKQIGMLEVFIRSEKCA